MRMPSDYRASQRLSVTAEASNHLPAGALATVSATISGLGDLLPQLGDLCARPLPGVVAEHEPRWAPMEPADLTAHRCIAYGDAHGELSPWSFERDGHAVTVVPGRGPVFNDGDLLVAAALEGFGILHIWEDLVAVPIADGRLTRLLDPWCEPFAGYHLYYPDRRGTTAFELFKEMLQVSRAV